jgi:2-oxoglutarate ferredoxin oxidoreductase subunit delta
MTCADVQILKPLEDREVVERKPRVCRRPMLIRKASLRGVDFCDLSTRGGGPDILSSFDVIEKQKESGSPMPGKGKIEINAELCKSCGYCMKHCPQGCIRRSDRYNLKGYTPAQFKDGECIGCAICALVCPEAAIEVWRA